DLNRAKAAFLARANHLRRYYVILIEVSEHPLKAGSDPGSSTGSFGCVRYGSMVHDGRNAYCTRYHSGGRDLSGLLHRMHEVSEEGRGRHLQQTRAIVPASHKSIR